MQVDAAKMLIPPATNNDSVHSLISEFESALRLASILALASARKDQTYAPKLRRNLGLGGWKEVLTSARGARIGETYLAARVVKLIEAVERIWREPLAGSPVGVNHLKPLRDYLSHGGLLDPDTETLAKALSDAQNLIRTAVGEFLQGANLDIHPQGADGQSVTLAIGDIHIGLSPFLIPAPGNRVLIYATGGPDSPTYFGTGRAFAREIRHDEAEHLKVFFPERDDGHPLVDQFARDLLEDLAAFSEAEGPVAVSDEDTVLMMSWRQATSAGSVERLDEFRLGRNDSREWRDGDKWVPYSKFLTRICNWQTIARRLGESFRAIESSLETVEAEYIGPTPRGEIIIPARVRVSDLDGGNASECSAEDVFSAADESAAENRGRTRITFINGEAGIGKTRAMLRAAIQRAERIARQESHGEPLPIYLYVRSTGHVLDNLSTVVEAAVARTRNLTDAGVKALARNGLLTLLIDGFDELLGNASYGDAMGSLRPWLNELSGRGVLIVSARSSYYLNQYKSSVARANAGTLAPVRHTVAEMLRWTTDELKSYLGTSGFDTTLLAHLSPEEMHLVRLPFFARIVATLPKERLSAPNFSLTSVLLEGYVRREATKLEVDATTETALISADELERTFEEAALLMAGEAQREIDLDTLQLAAEVTLEGGLESRPLLSARLPNLCGLGVDVGASTARFRFQHEVYFDEFFAARIARLVRHGEEQQFVDALGYDTWREGMVTSVLAKSKPEAVRRLVEEAQVRGPSAGLGRTREDMWRTNLGSVWNALIKRTNARGARLEVRGVVIIDTLDLTALHDVKIGIFDSRIDVLILPPSGRDWRVDVARSVIGRLEHGDGRLTGLYGIAESAINELMTKSELTVSADRIVDLLSRLGAQVPNRDRSHRSDTSTVARGGKRFLRRIVERGDNALVLREDRAFEDESFDKGLWDGAYADMGRFVRALEKFGMAECSSFSARGPKKVRLRFTVSPDRLLAEVPDDAVEAFWQSFR